MADNIQVTTGSGIAIAGDLISGGAIALYQRVKLIHGIDGVNDGDVASVNPLPVTISEGTITVNTIATITVLNTVSTVIVSNTASTVTVLNTASTVTVLNTASTVTVLNTASTVTVNAITTASTIKVYSVGAATMVSGRTVVPTAGTSVVLTASTTCFRVDLSADLGNANYVVVGDSNVVAATGSQIGLAVIGGNSPISVLVDNLDKIYVDALTNGDAICYTYYAY